MNRSSSILWMLPLLALVGCGEHPDPNPPDSGTITCQEDSRVTAYSAGMTQKSDDGSVQVKLVSADPAPPLRGMNTWQVQVQDGSGNPIDGATVSVDLYMPDHGHSSPTTPTVTAQSNGAYEISNLNFFMPGVWRARFTVTRDTTTELVDFFFCVAG